MPTASTVSRYGKGGVLAPYKSQCGTIPSFRQPRPRDERYSDDDEEDGDDPIAAFANRAIMSHLITAFHSAVLIFFYRRVRQLHPFLLQPFVEKTIANLEAFEQEQRNFSLVNCGIVWPGFIAGAEAVDPDLQARFYKRLQECSRSSGKQNFGFAAEFLQDFWALRRQKGNENMTWMDMVRDKQLALVLT